MMPVMQSRPPCTSLTARAAAVLALLAAGCASSPGVPPLVPARSADCIVAPALGDVAAVRRASGELVVTGSTRGLLVSTDLGRRWAARPLPVDCLWPDLAEVDGRLLQSCAEPRPTARLLVLAEAEDGGWQAPVVVATTDELLIDTCLQPTASSEVLLFATHVDRPRDLDDAVYTVRQYRSLDGGSTWSEPRVVVTGKRGQHLEDTRSLRLDDGSLLLLNEVERREGRRSVLVQRRSVDGGATWTLPEVVWRGSDLEPGGYLVLPDGELWLVASSDRAAGGGSYGRAIIEARSSLDRGATWSEPFVLVGEEDQLSFGGVLLPGGDVLVPSVRHYNRPGRRSLALYVVADDGSGSWRCALDEVFADGFDDPDAGQWEELLPPSSR
jgi:hypothetical protein